MKWLRRIFGLLIVIVILFLGIGFVLPADYHVERAVIIEAPTARVHALVGDLAQWDRWAPWKEADPTMVVTLGDVTAGVGAHQSWSGDSGSGELTVRSSDPEWGIEYDLDFDRGRYISVGALHYETVEGGTRVTWTMGGRMGANPVERWFGLLMDWLAGRDFRKGLDRLKAVAEAD
jgi:uncharacterized protein YndB with AHSA1/START domain